MSPREIYCNYCLGIIDSCAEQIVHNHNHYHSVCWKKTGLLVFCPVHQRMQYRQKKWIEVNEEFLFHLQEAFATTEIIYQQCDRCSEEPGADRSFLLNLCCSAL